MQCLGHDRQRRYDPPASEFRHTPGQLRDHVRSRTALDHVDLVRIKSADFQQIVQQAVNAIKGKPTKSILTSLAVLTKSNLKKDSSFIYKSSC